MFQIIFLIQTLNYFSNWLKNVNLKLRNLKSSLKSLISKFMFDFDLRKFNVNLITILPNQTLVVIEILYIAMS